MPFTDLLAPVRLHIPDGFLSPLVAVVGWWNPGTTTNFATSASPASKLAVRSPRSAMSITPLSSAEYTSPVGNGVTDTPMAPITAEASPTKRPFLPDRSAGVSMPLSRNICASQSRNRPAVAGTRASPSL